MNWALVLLPLLACGPSEQGAIHVTPTRVAPKPAHCQSIRACLLCGCAPGEHCLFIKSDVACFTLDAEEPQ